MPSIDDIYEDNAPLKAEDLRGKDVTLTIKAAEPKTYDDGDRKLVLRFHKASRTLPLNRVNARTIADMHGGDFEQWADRKITLYATTTEFRGNMVPCIRVKPPETVRHPDDRLLVNPDPPMKDSRAALRGYSADDENELPF
jgi:hypothetical protein